MYASKSLFEDWTFGLCWNSQNNCSVLNVPSVLSSAEKYSQFGRVFLKAFFDQGESFNFEESYKARNVKLNYSKIEQLLSKNLVA
uniref:Uncharacterized protein n=1 Tax=Panagrolaimus sp. PS1159 TaxID=55785 RepID=A0AC35GDU6_9BILA